MIELWIPISIAAAFFQNLRSALQKYLKGQLSDAGATFVRFGFGFPVAILYVLVLHFGIGISAPEPNGTFFFFLILGGSSQVFATFLLVRLFSFRNFAVGTAYSKTEPVQAAIFGILLLGESATLGAVLGIAISTGGVILISLARSERSLNNIFKELRALPALIGLASGALFGIAAVSYRGASLALDGPGFLMPAAYTLAWVTVYQTLIMLLYLRIREPLQLGAVLRNWRPASLVGVAGILGSVGWFTAMTLQKAAYVKAVGQIELIFTIVASVFFFREALNRFEYLGVALIGGGILLLVLIA